MPKINTNDVTVFNLFSNVKTDFLIPDYQRPYAWGKTECETLWNDLFNFAFPDNNSSNFNQDEYFLGPIVTFENDNKQEVIDGQQRLTTLLLLLRAFYSRFGKMKDETSVDIKKRIENCIWKTNEVGNTMMDQLKIESEVITDDDKNDFMFILKNGCVEETMKSKYATNYKLFEKLIQNFSDEYPIYFALFPARILNNCILLSIEANSQDSALRIFSTLNDRGKPLSDSDIFKAQLYKHYSSIGRKDDFMKAWKELENRCNNIFENADNPVDEIFTRYMYYERAKQNNKDTTTESLRKFYEKNTYGLLKNENTFDNIVLLSKFWEKIVKQDESLSKDVLNKLFVLNYAPNGMWVFILSVYYMANKDSEGNVDNESLGNFLEKITAFIWMYSFTNSGVNALRTPIFPEMIKIVNGEDVSFNNYKKKYDEVYDAVKKYSFANSKVMTKSMVVWWAFQLKEQEYLSLEEKIQIEHIFATKRYDKDDKSLSDPLLLEALGNKAMLEKRINIAASDYRFKDKRRYYEGYNAKNGKKVSGTNNIELIEMIKQKTDYTEADIIDRNERIISCFMKYLKSNNLLT